MNDTGYLVSPCGHTAGITEVDRPDGRRVLRCNCCGTDFDACGRAATPTKS